MALSEEIYEITPVLTMPNGGPVLGLPDGPSWIDLSAGDAQVVFPPRYQRTINIRVAALASGDPRWREPVESQLNRVVKLSEGWDSYGGHPVSIETATAAVGLLSMLWPTEGVAPSIAPLPSGGLTMAWRAGKRVVDIDVESNRYDVYIEDAGVVIAEGDLRENLQAVRHYLNTSALLT